MVSVAKLMTLTALDIAEFGHAREEVIVTVDIVDDSFHYLVVIAASNGSRSFSTIPSARVAVVGHQAPRGATRFRFVSAQTLEDRLGVHVRVTKIGTFCQLKSTQHPYREPASSPGGQRMLGRPLPSRDLPCCFVYHVQAILCRATSGQA